ncbi:MAG: transposase [Firmicutes bacterium]|nr:transposase [Bacillota bacterium]
MASPRIKNNHQEITLVFIRLFVFVAIVLIIGLSVWLTAVVGGLPWGYAAAIAGITAGVTGFFLLFFGSLYEVNTFTCSNCGQTDRVLKHIGTYNCFNCGTLYYIYDRENTKLNNQQDMEQCV